ncbi:MAG: hypothetical protein GY794_14290 [bacterium]|nr:hypothetical protein [bacterium]
MNRYAFLATTLSLTLLIGLTQAADKNLHIPSGRSVRSNWTVNDSAGFRWDIYLKYGQVNDGTYDAYDGGMQLHVGGATMSVSQTGRLSKARDEIEIGPWKRGAVNVYRRIYVDKKIGYCRWIDIFENTSSSAQTLSLRYYSNLGSSVRSSYSTTAQANVTGKDWGFVTGSSRGSRPSIVHVFASKNAKVKPRVQFRRGDDNIYYHYTLKIPPKRAVALCHIEAQRRPVSSAKKFLKEFKVEGELKKIPASLRRIILNMGGAMLTMGSLKLPRHDEHDLIVQRGGNELLGTIKNTEYVIDTLQGKMTLPAARVVGLQAPTGAGDRIKLGLIDGQVVVGKLTNGAVKLKLVNGNVMSLKVDKIDTAAYRVSPQRPEEIAFLRPMMVLRNGQQLFFKKTDADWGFHTQYGRITLRPEDITNLILDTPDGGLHRAIFSNGSVLSGLMVQEDLKLTLDLGPELAIKRYLVSKFIMPTKENTGSGLGELKLKNEDTLIGRIADESIKIRTANNDQVSVKGDDIASITVPEEASLGIMKVKLHNGTTVDGTLAGKTIAFQVTPGPKLDIYVGHIVQINQSKPTTKPTAKPASKPKPATTKPLTAAERARAAAEREKAAAEAKREKAAAALDAAKTAVQREQAEREKAAAAAADRT